MERCAEKMRGELDALPDLVRFGEALEAASLQTLNDGIMTKDLCGLAEGITPPPWTASASSKAIRERLGKKCCEPLFYRITRKASASTADAFRDFIYAFTSFFGFAQPSTALTSALPRWPQKFSAGGGGP